MTAKPFPDRIGPYQVLGPLGQGAMSHVYRASLPLLGHQEYAVKLLRERCKPSEVSAFLGECTKVKRLGTHPHIVPLYFAGRDRRLGRYYVVMELIQGLTAAQLLAETPAHQLPVARAVRIATQVALGLEHAHQRGILHLDVKPSNILLEADGDRAKLTDFGSAQLQEDVSLLARYPRIGTPAYRAWEQTPTGTQAGLAPDRRSDIYGLAATLYHLLTGQVPQWTADGALRSPTQWCHELPGALEALLTSALSRDPEQRPQTMEAFRRALEEWTAPHRVSVRGLLPVPMTSLVGRATLFQTLKQRLIAGETLALSALGGLPGVGKTALAVAVVTDPEVQDHFAEGILWAGLGKTPDVQAVLSTWGAVLGITSEEAAGLRGIEAWAQAVRTHIGTRRILLVLDDAWTIEAALACRVGGPHAVHLLTTRSPELALQFAGAGLLPVPELAESDGIELLAQLAPQVVGEQPEDARALVHAVGGLPLGLVLLGKHLQLQSYGGQPRRIQATLDRLKQRGERLRLAQPQAPAVPHTSLPSGTPLSLQASIGLSDTALNSEERAMLRALAVFLPKPTSFSEEAALAVSLGTVAALDRLVDAGLVESAGPGRYYLHQTIVDYARLQGVPDAAYERLAEAMVALLERSQHDYAALDQDMGNLLAGLEAAFTLEQHAPLVRGVLSFRPFLEARGLYTILHEQLCRAYQAAQTLADPVSLVALLLQTGHVQQKLGDYAQAETAFADALHLARAHQQDQATCAALAALGALAGRRGDYAQADEYLQAGLLLARQVGLQDPLPGLLTSLGNLATYQGNYAQAEAYLQEGLSLARQLGPAERMSVLLMNLGILAEKRGHLAHAEAYYQEGLAVARQVGQQEDLMGLLNNLGSVTMARGDVRQAGTFLQEALALARQSQYPEQLAFVLANLGALAIQCDDLAQAEAYGQEGLTLARQLGHREITAVLLTLLGTHARHARDYVQATAFLQEAQRLAETVSYPLLQIVVCQEWGELHLAQHHPQSAAQALKEALRLARAEGHQQSIAQALYGLAQTEEAEGALDEAQRLGAASLTILETMGHYQVGAVRHWLSKLAAHSAAAEEL